MHTGLFHEIDFDADGKTLSFLGTPYSVDRSPITRSRPRSAASAMARGSACCSWPATTATSEGEIALGRLIRRLDPARVRGEITILPMANVPAVMAARRRSPLDNGNLNRAFPGSPGGTPTERLAHFLEHERFRHDVVFDIHSGGTSMAHLPTALIENRRTRRAWTRRWRCWPAWAWTTPSSPPTGATRPPRWRGHRAGAIGISGEFGGGGTLTPATLAATQRAIDQLLLALDVIDAPVLGTRRPTAACSCWPWTATPRPSSPRVEAGSSPPWTLAPRSARAIWRATITT